MKFNCNVLNNDERIIFALRSVYSRHGYKQYRMSKFEEYDLYSRNKDFLVSDGVITFTDTNGKLMALKPDVTLSLIKNTRDIPGKVQKLFYNENVYRISKGTNSFKEIMQVGLECIGDLDDASIDEVIVLAAESLAEISEEFVLDISHLGILSSALNRMTVSTELKEAVLKCVEEKNLHGIRALCEANALPASAADGLLKLLKLHGSAKSVLPVLRELTEGWGVEEEVRELELAAAAFEATPWADRLQVDFSQVNNMSFYNGIVFKGYINGVPAGVLSGGQYGKLMKKLGRRSRAIGFAVYMDVLEYLDTEKVNYDAVLEFRDGEVKILENNA